MAVICKEHAELRCDCYPDRCYGCNAFANPTNFDRFKYEISKMNMEEFIEFCGIESCENRICAYIPVNYAHCANKKPYDCCECIREYLGRKPD